MTDTTLAGAVGQQLPEPGTYEIDPSHSVVGFSARHLMVSRVRGRFASFSGTITVADPPEQSAVEVTIDAASIDTGDARRDEHLRGGDFLDVEHHPTLTFRSTSVQVTGDDRLTVTGDLTVRGESHPVTLDVSYEGAADDPWGGHRIGFEARAEIDREAWGLTWNAPLEGGGVVVGKKVRLELSAEAARS